MKTTLLTFILLTQLIAFGQYPRQKLLLEKIQSDLKQLHFDKIDSVAYFMPYFVGDRKGIRVSQNASKELIEKLQCEESDIVYLLWQKNGTTHITKYNECGKLKTITSDTILFIREMAANFDVIKNTKVKPFQLVNEKNNTLSSTISHSGIWEITVQIADKKYSNIIDLYKLNPASDNDKNINAEYNNKLALIKLLDRLNRQLYSLKFK